MGATPAGRYGPVSFRAFGTTTPPGPTAIQSCWAPPLGIAYVEARRLNEARKEFLGLLEYHRSEGIAEGVGLAHINLGELEYAAGNLATAEEHFAAAADSFRAIGFKVRLAGALQGLAAVEARSGKAESAAKHLGAASALLTDVGWVHDGLALEEPATTAARETLGDETFERLFGEGLRSEASQRERAGPAAAS